MNLSERADTDMRTGPQAGFITDLNIKIMTRKIMKLLWNHIFGVKVLFC